MKVLVTAFKPFGKCTNNYSEEVIKYIDNVDKIVLDVCYDKCYSDLSKAFDLNEYDLVIAMGEARMRNVLTLETMAKNISSCRLADNSGIVKIDEKIIDNGIEQIITKVDVDKVHDMIQLSSDAGKFVCNNIYFHLLNNYPEKSLFIHIPECQNDVNKYNLYANTITNVIERLIK